MSCKTNLHPFYLKAIFNLIAKGKKKEASTLLTYVYKMHKGELIWLDEMEEASELLQISED